MDIHAFETFLRKTLADRKLSTAERRVLQQTLEEARPAVHHVHVLRASLFRMAREALDDPRATEILGWVEDVVKLLHADPAGPSARPTFHQACFSPGDACRQALVHQLEQARRRVDVCVFTITDDAITRALRAAHGRGVAVRILTDDEKAGDLGSDVERLAGAGIAVRADDSPAHMHHKFALFDGEVVATGSYNWTRSAWNENQENLVVTNAETLVRAFQAEFDRLWARFGA